MKSRPTSLSVVTNTSSNEVTDELIKAVEGFDMDCDEFPEKLNEFLSHVAETGNILTSWNKVQKVFIHKLKTVMDEFYEETPYKAGKVNPNCENESFEYLREVFLKQASSFESPPFTFQRLCELIQNRKKNYTKCEKFMRAIEKNLTVVSSWSYPPRRSAGDPQGTNGSSDFNTPAKPEMGGSMMSYPGPRPALPPSPMLTTSNHVTTMSVDSNDDDGDSDGVMTVAAPIKSLTQALEEADCEEDEEKENKKDEDSTDDASTKMDVSSDEVTSSSSSVEPTANLSPATDDDVNNDDVSNKSADECREKDADKVENQAGTETTTTTSPTKNVQEEVEDTDESMEVDSKPSSHQGTASSTTSNEDVENNTTSTSSTKESEQPETSVATTTTTVAMVPASPKRKREPEEEIPSTKDAAGGDSIGQPLAGSSPKRSKIEAETITKPTDEFTSTKTDDEVTSTTTTTIKKDDEKDQ